MLEAIRALEWITARLEAERGALTRDDVMGTVITARERGRFALHQLRERSAFVRRRNLLHGAPPQSSPGAGRRNVGVGIT